MRLVLRHIMSLFFIISIFCCLTAYAEDAAVPESAIDMIPRDSLAYISLSDLDAVYYSVIESPEWEELLGIEYIKGDLEKGNQAVQFLPMLLGITVEEFLNAFGHSTVLILMEMRENMPVAGLVVDVRSYKDQAEYAVEQTATIPALVGGAMIEEKEYRGVPYTTVGNKTITVNYGFLGNFLLAGVNGGFEKLVDFYMDGGESIKTSHGFQFMEQKVSSSGNIFVYADLERGEPFLRQVLGIGKSPRPPLQGGEEAIQEEEKAVQGEEAIPEIALKTMKAFALSLSLSGQTQEAYLHLRAEESNPITDLVLAPYSPMSSVDLIPFADGAMMGIQLGDPADLLDKSLKLAQFFEVDMDELESGIKNIEDALKLDLRKDLLSAITGEFAVVTMLPEGPIDLENKMRMFLEMAKIRPAILIGVKDKETLSETVKKLLGLANVETRPIQTQSYKGAEIHYELLPLDALAPGIALTPAYTFRDDLLIMSNSAGSVRDTIDVLESSQPARVKEELSESRVLFYLDAGGIANTVGEVMEKGFGNGTELPESMKDKLSSLGSIAASLSWGPDGLGIKLVSASDDNWTTKILRGVLATIYMNIPSGELKEAQEEIKNES